MNNKTNDSTWWKDTTWENVTIEHQYLAYIFCTKMCMILKMSVIYIFLNVLVFLMNEY